MSFADAQHTKNTSIKEKKEEMKRKEFNITIEGSNNDVHIVSGNTLLDGIRILGSNNDKICYVPKDVKVLIQGKGSNNSIYISKEIIPNVLDSLSGNHNVIKTLGQ